VSSRVAGLALAALLVLALAGCGRKELPHTPDGAFYPQHYPALVLPVESGGTRETLEEMEYQQMLETQRREAAAAAAGLAPPPAKPMPAPAPITFDDLHHPEADTTPGTTPGATRP
jgi:hypothetical protein